MGGGGGRAVRAAGRGVEGAVAAAEGEEEKATNGTVKGNPAIA